MSLDAVIALAQYEFGADPDLRCFYCGKPVSGDFGTLRGDPVCEDGICVPEEEEDD